MLVYSGILLLICAALGLSLAMRSPFRVDVLCDRAALARTVEDGNVENVYRLQIMNATEATQRYRVTAEGLPGLRLSEVVSLELRPVEARWVSIALRVPPETAAGTAAGAHEIQFTIEQQAQATEVARSLHEESTFVVPR